MMLQSATPITSAPLPLQSIRLSIRPMPPIFSKSESRRNF